MNDRAGSRRHYRIYSHVTASSFLHIEDALAIGKVRLFAGKYQKGQGTTATAHHYLDLDDARLVFTDLAAGKVPLNDEKDQSYVEYKGSGEGIPTSRILKVQARPDRVFIELSYGPGERAGEGIVRPARGAERQNVSVALTWLEARRLALAVLAHLAAWEAATFHARIAAALAQPAEEVYEPVPAPGPAEEPVPVPSEEPIAAAPAPSPSEEPTPPPPAKPEPPADTSPQPQAERADATAYWQLANTEAARAAVDPAQIKEWAIKAQQYKRWDLAIRRLKEAIARNQ